MKAILKTVTIKLEWRQRGNLRQRCKATRQVLIEAIKELDKRIKEGKR